MIFDAKTLQATIEEGWEVGDPTSRYLSVTGEPYVVIGSQTGIPRESGIVDECQAREWAFDAETAYFQALACFESYAHGKFGKLYWRCEPRLENANRRPPFPLYGCRVIFYMRCLISDRPLIAKAA